MFSEDAEHGHGHAVVKIKRVEAKQQLQLTQLISQSQEDFLPFISLIQDLLAEIGKLRITVNDLQVEIFKKVEESQKLFEQRIMGVLRLLEHPPVKVQPRSLAIDQKLWAVENGLSHRIKLDCLLYFFRRRRGAFARGADRQSL